MQYNNHKYVEISSPFCKWEYIQGYSLVISTIIETCYSSYMQYNSHKYKYIEISQFCAIDIQQSSSCSFQRFI